MSTQITTAFVQQYKANIFTLTQQRGSRLRPLVRTETVTGTSAYFEQIGAATAQVKGARHSATPQIDTPQSRRRLDLVSYNWADLIDRSDKVRMLIDPTSEYAQAGANALGRSMDDVIIAAIRGTSKTGVDGSTNVALPNAQKVVSLSAGAGSTLNVAALRTAKQIIDSADVDPSLPRFIVANPANLMALLAQTEVANHDYNTIRALVQGEVDTFLGFKFIMSNRLVTQSGSLLFNTTTGTVGSGSGDCNGYRSVLAFVGDGVMLGMGQDIIGKISERPDLNYSTQVYAEMDLGATRMEETKVVEILCANS